jgi:sulfate adenylyltransferase subunit 1
MEAKTKTLLKFITCGSVDDGKSTLIGRLLYDSKSLLEDRLGSLEKESKKYGTTGGELDLALLVDGLQSEREQGITIDISHQFFASEKRKYIIIDTPGHEQYTRNMATGASNADAAVILVDARKGILTQTKRHSFIVNLLGVKHLIVAINKMDLVDFSEEVFLKIKEQFITEVATKLDLKDLIFIPISALKGDNIVDISQNMPWYKDAPLLNILDDVELKNDSFDKFRLQVQYVNRPNLDFRGFCGTISGGEIRAGDEIVILPKGKKTKVKALYNQTNSEVAGVHEAITITTTEEIDISRGDLIVKPNEGPNVSNKILANIIWMSENELKPNARYNIKFGALTTSGEVNNIEYLIDVNTLAHKGSANLSLNDIALCTLKLDKQIPFDLYKESRATGSFIIIDRITNDTVGAGVIKEALADESKTDYSEFEIELNALFRKHFPHWEAKAIF